MTTQEFLIKQIEDGIPSLLGSVKAVPEDKLDWKPAEGNRTIRQVFTEVVMMFEYTSQALEQRGVPPYDELAASYAAKPVSELIELMPKNAEKLYAVIRSFPESEYENTLEAPWGTRTYLQTMSYPYWNMMWHAGQINYVQAMYGDQNFY